MDMDKPHKLFLLYKQSKSLRYIYLPMDVYTVGIIKILGIT